MSLVPFKNNGNCVLWSSPGFSVVIPLCIMGWGLGTYPPYCSDHYSWPLKAHTRTNTRSTAPLRRLGGATKKSLPDKLRVSTPNRDRQTCFGNHQLLASIYLQAKLPWKWKFIIYLLFSNIYAVDIIPLLKMTSSQIISLGYIKKKINNSKHTVCDPGAQNQLLGSILIALNKLLLIINSIDIFINY